MSNRRIRATCAIAAALLAAALSHRLWLPLIGRFLIVADPFQPAEAVVPLAGERSRVIYAATLLAQGQAQWFVITDMRVHRSHPAPSYAESVQAQAVRAGVPIERIRVAPGQASTTYEEALNLRQMAQTHQWRSLIVVTSPFHTRRARLILRDVFRDTGIALRVQPVPGHWYTPDRWWTTFRGVRVTALEYVKLVLYLLGYERYYRLKGKDW